MNNDEIYDFPARGGIDTASRRMIPAIYDSYTRVKASATFFKNSRLAKNLGSW
ncbi:MAG: hypothetical protein ACLT13_12200 [Parabacteroides merdae]|uniref:hypothetical protein n=1 Tax=Parabacteroides merdae TaxID=46503 RepID=UPI0002E3F4E1|nr:hypothetical protein [Parabacteroides merdae]MDB8894200.1 hypothetical protein [Parabacteroides merdae]MDB8897862.1 hypothetical protein [Parabacteroides merdae]